MIDKINPPNDQKTTEITQKIGSINKGSFGGSSNFQIPNRQTKERKLTVGFFAALHTYGRQLNFNTHIHLSLADYGLNTHGDLKKRINQKMAKRLTLPSFKLSTVV